MIAMDSSNGFKEVNAYKGDDDIPDLLLIGHLQVLTHFVIFKQNKDELMFNFRPNLTKRFLLHFVCCQHSPII
jgi:hypothetical protein